MDEWLVTIGTFLVLVEAVDKADAIRQARHELFQQGVSWAWLHAPTTEVHAER